MIRINNVCYKFKGGTKMARPKLKMENKKRFEQYMERRKARNMVQRRKLNIWRAFHIEPDFVCCGMFPHQET